MRAPATTPELLGRLQRRPKSPVSDPADWDLGGLKVGDAAIFSGRSIRSLRRDLDAGKLAWTRDSSGHRIVSRRSLEQSIGIDRGGS
jgi:hypothetical protein